MPFANSTYEADNGEIHPIRLAPETLAAAGGVPAGAISSSIRVKISKARNEFGVSPRCVRASRVRGTAPDQFLDYVTVPVLTLGIWASAAFQIGATINVDGEDYTIISRINEDVN